MKDIGLADSCFIIVEPSSSKGLLITEYHRCIYITDGTLITDYHGKKER